MRGAPERGTPVKRFSKSHSSWMAAGASDDLAGLDGPDASADGDAYGSAGQPVSVWLRPPEKPRTLNETKDGAVDALTYDLLKIARRKAEGSFATQANRRAMLKQMAETLKEGGFILPSARSIKPKHIEFLLERWREAEVSDRTILNRLAVLRWWVEAVDKRSIMARDNEAYGVTKPVPGGKARAYNLAPEQLQFIPCPRVQASLELQAAFGLRREEAIKFRPGEALRADLPDRIELKASWTKGGRPRTVPIVNEQQRDLLARVAALVGTGSLIPADKTYVAQLEVYKYQTRRAGIRNPHGLRHAYAQRRYREMTGWEPPAVGGTLPATEAAIRLDYDVRRQISEELGHNRIAITKVYLG